MQRQGFPAGEPAARPSGQPRRRSHRRATRSATVVVADDNELQRASARVALEASGYTVLEAANGREAVALVRGRRPDLVLMDVVMPGLDGVSAARVIRAEAGNGADVPIVFVTGNETERDRRRALAAGGNEYLVKPVTVSALLRAVRRWTGRAERPDAKRGGRR